jgi:hypothetical protein
MYERFDNITFTLVDLADADGVAGVYFPTGFTLTHISAFGSSSGSPTAETIDIQVATADVVTAHDIAPNGLVQLTAPIQIAALAVLEIDLNLTAGTTPAYTGTITLWGYHGSV